jgi:hypothetical protein
MTDSHGRNGGQNCCCRSPGSHGAPHDATTVVAVHVVRVVRVYVIEAPLIVEPPQSLLWYSVVAASLIPAHSRHQQLFEGQIFLIVSRSPALVTIWCLKVTEDSTSHSNSVGTMHVLVGLIH